MPSALAGVKVLDFGWVIAVPLASKTLAEYGATVVRVESKQRLDLLRAYALYVNGPGVNRCPYFGAFNNDKFGLTLNLNHRKSLVVVERLVKWADIVLENFTAGTLDEWGLGYDDLRRMNPQVVMIRASLFGQHGPYAKQSGFGTMMQALAGFTRLVGWPDRPPVGSPAPYTDYVAPWYIISIAIAALDRRRRTGEGACVDLSQLEAGIHFQLPAMLNASVNHRVIPAAGNRHPSAVPHGVFRCLGEDRWCTISVYDDDQWTALCSAMGMPAWCLRPEFSTLLGRKRNEGELERLIEEWTSQHSSEAVVALLQARGVPSASADNGRDTLDNVQLRHRGHFATVPHSEMGDFVVEAPSSRLSKTPAQLRRGAPCLGEHTEQVCRELLGMRDEEFVELLSGGVFE